MISEVPHADLERAFSPERFARYLSWAAGDRDRAVELYTLNTRVSESLYIPLQILEVTLRNRLHAVMTQNRHDNWFQDEGFLLGDRQPEQLAKALQDIAAGKKEATPGRIVAELTFSFWTAMFGPAYENLWQTTLHHIGKKPSGKGLRRKDFSSLLTPIRTLRNRVAHYEPIIAWDIGKHHAKMVELIAWLSPAAAAWCREHDRFDDVYPIDRIKLATDAIT